MSVVNEVASSVKPVIGKQEPKSVLLTQLSVYLQRPEIGGLQGLVQKFEKAGLGPQVQSWIGTGKSLPITPDEVTRGLGSADVSLLATKTGLSTQQVSQQLSEILPQAVKNLKLNVL